MRPAAFRAVLFNPARLARQWKYFETVGSVYSQTLKCCLPLVFATILLFLKAVVFFFSLCAAFLHVFLVKDNESLPCIAINYSQVTTLFIYGTFGNGIISQTFCSDCFRFLGCCKKLLAIMMLYTHTRE